MLWRAEIWRLMVFMYYFSPQWSANHPTVSSHTISKMLWARRWSLIVLFLISHLLFISKSNIKMVGMHNFNHFLTFQSVTLVKKWTGEGFTALVHFEMEKKTKYVPICAASNNVTYLYKTFIKQWMDYNLAFVYSMHTEVSPRFF